MKHFLIGLAGVLLIAGVILAAGFAETMNLAGIGAGIGCVALAAVITTALDKAGAFDEEGDDVEDDR